MNLTRKIPKSVIFAAVAAFGCFVAALIAEPLFTESPPIVIPRPPMPPMPPEPPELPVQPEPPDVPMPPSPPVPPGPFFVFCFDDSGSMSERGSAGRSKRDDVKEAAKEFASARNLEKEKIGIVVFSNTSREFLPLSHDKRRILSVIDSYSHSGGTYFADALDHARVQFEGDLEVERLNKDYEREYRDYLEQVETYQQQAEDYRQEYEEYLEQFEEYLQQVEDFQQHVRDYQQQVQDYHQEFRNYLKQIELVNEKIGEVNALITTGRIQGKAIEQLSPQTDLQSIPQLILDSIRQSDQQLDLQPAPQADLQPVPESSPESAPRIVLFFTDGQNFDEAEALQQAGELREKGIRIYAISTMDGNKNYLTEMTGSAEQVFMVNDAQIKDAFKQMEERINADIRVEPRPEVPPQVKPEPKSPIRYEINAEIFAPQSDFLKDVSKKQTVDESGNIAIFVGTGRLMQIVQSTVWSMLLCLGMCIFIVIVQNRMMRKPPVIAKQLATLCVGGAGGGLLAGFCGDAVFQMIPVVFVGRLVGLGVLGAILAFGMSFFIANLDRKWAFIGGAFGGVLGTVGFTVSTLMAGQTSGRLLGAVLLGASIGAMIGIAEMLSRKVWLAVVYSPRDVTIVNLGPQTVTVGSGSNDTVRIRNIVTRAAEFRVDGKDIRYKGPDGNRNLEPGARIKLGDVELVVCSQDAMFSPSRFYPIKFARAMELKSQGKIPH